MYCITTISYFPRLQRLMLRHLASPVCQMRSKDGDAKASVASRAWCFPQNITQLAERYSNSNRCHGHHSDFPEPLKIKEWFSPCPNLWWLINCHGYTKLDTKKTTTTAPPSTVIPDSAPNWSCSKILGTVPRFSIISSQVTKPHFPDRSVYILIIWSYSVGFSRSKASYSGFHHFHQWEFQDPKMEVLYHIRPYFRGISPYIALI